MANQSVNMQLDRQFAIVLRHLSFSLASLLQCCVHALHSLALHNITDLTLVLPRKGTYACSASHSSVKGNSAVQATNSCCIVLHVTTW